MGVNASLHLIVTSRECSIVAVNGAPSNACISSIRADVKDLWPTSRVGFSLSQAASISFVVPLVVSLAALAAKQQSSIIRT